MRTLTAILVFLALTFGASADGCVPTTSDPEIVVPGTDLKNWFYVDNDLCQLPPDGSLEPNDIFDWYTGGSYGGEPGGACFLSIWIYEESNGIEGLQRGDVMVDNTCGGMIEADTLTPY